MHEVLDMRAVKRAKTTYAARVWLGRGVTNKMSVLQHDIESWNLVKGSLEAHVVMRVDERVRALSERDVLMEAAYSEKYCREKSFVESQSRNQNRAREPNEPFR